MSKQTDPLIAELVEALSGVLAVMPSQAPAAGLIVGISDRYRAAVSIAKAALARAQRADHFPDAGEKVQMVRYPLTDEQMQDALRTCPIDAVQNLRVRWLYAKDFARAIERAHGITKDTKEVKQ